MWNTLVVVFRLGRSTRLDLKCTSNRASGILVWSRLSSFDKKETPMDEQLEEEKDDELGQG